MSLCEVRCCWTVAVGLSCLQYCAGAFEIQDMRVGIVQIVLRMAHKRAHMRAHTEAPWVPQREDLEVRLL